MIRSLNGTRNQMWKQTDEQAVLDKGPGGFESSFIDLYDISHLLKRIKGNPWRKNDADQRNGNIMDAQHCEGIRKGVDEEIKIFEDAKNPKVQEERKEKPL